MGEIRALDNFCFLSSARILPMVSRSLLRGVDFSIAEVDTIFDNLNKNSLIDSFPSCLTDEKKSCMSQCSVLIDPYITFRMFSK